MTFAGTRKERHVGGKVPRMVQRKSPTQDEPGFLVKRFVDFTRRPFAVLLVSLTVAFNAIEGTFCVSLPLDNFDHGLPHKWEKPSPDLST